mmetsp:Transcript_49501/g.115793  ORF Transcript_49501/g.115793 Transcript_49501/m.115793 type:complete len:89 (+) Transcript_49501:42-308(+)
MHLIALRSHHWSSLKRQLLEWCRLSNACDLSTTVPCEFGQVASMPVLTSCQLGCSLQGCSLIFYTRMYLRMSARRANMSMTPTNDSVK